MNRPNIILIVLDTVRADHLSCYRYGRQTTPVLDSLAGEGALFEQAIAPAPWTLPSHVSMFTGLLPSKHGAHRDHHRFDTPYVTLAQLLSEQGYRSVGFSNVQWVDEVTGAVRGFQEFHGRDVWRAPLPKENPLSHVRDKGAARIIDGVKRWIREKKDDQPFFFFINLFEPHTPYIPPVPYDKLYLSSADMEKVPHINQDVLKYYVGKAPITQDDFRVLGHLYDGELTYLDTRVGELVEYLRQNQLLDDCLLFITADHGENIGEHGHFEHRYCLYETVIHVPLIVRYPAMFENGKRIPAAVQTIDIYPTVMDILGIDREDIRTELQGESLFSASSPTRRRAFTVSEWMPKPSLKRYDEEPDFDASVFAYGLRSIRYQGYKLIRGTHGVHELFNLEKDPEEKVNLFREEPDKAKELASILEAWVRGEKVSQSPAYTLLKDEGVDPEIRNRLRDLGYVD
jgi:arylsulfatase A-like enzyme